MMIRVEAHEDHAAGDHLLLIDIGDLEAQNLRVKPDGLFEIAAVQHDMADLGDRERRRCVLRHRLDARGAPCIGHNPLPCSVHACSQRARMRRRLRQ